MFSDDDLIPLSALQHLLFCERQCALIHVEGLWAENSFTVQGQHLHQRVHAAGTENRSDVRLTRGLPLLCERLGLTGKADLVEFHRLDDGSARDPDRAGGAVRLADTPGLWRPFPVEYKRGRPKRGACDRLQLCAQALCLEEMLGVVIPAGALFYGKTRRRMEVTFDASLRGETEEAVARVRWLVTRGITPPAVPPEERRAKCARCSLVNLCLPGATGGEGAGVSAAAYLARELAAVRPAAPPAAADSS